ncbi:MAG: nucleotidyltransferase family protein [Pseudomonadota bacterium]
MNDSVFVSGIVLAAGQSSRMGPHNKLTTPWRGKPLVAHVVDAALESDLDDFVVVTGHDREAIEMIFPSHIKTVHASDYAKGMAHSLSAGVQASAARPPWPDGIMVLLGDMPLVSSAHINALVSAFAKAKANGIAAPIVVATSDGERGNPVVFDRSFADDLLALSGDEGAKQIVASNFDSVVTVEIGAAARRDFDTPDAFFV